MDKRKVSLAVIRRLPRYYRYINDLSEAGVDRVSSDILAQKMGLTASQIRQDLNCFGGFGQQGYGYNVLYLRQELASILGLDRSRKAILIGVGNMGRALINHFNFKQCGVTLIAAFDADVSLIGKPVNRIPVLHIDGLEEFQKLNNADIAVLTVPKSAAYKTSELLCKTGIKGLWNFTTAELQLEGISVPVENVRFADSLMTLAYFL